MVNLYQAPDTSPDEFIKSLDESIRDTRRLKKEHRHRARDTLDTLSQTQSRLKEIRGRYSPWRPLWRFALVAGAASAMTFMAYDLVERGHRQALGHRLQSAQTEIETLHFYAADLENKVYALEDRLKAQGIKYDMASNSNINKSPAHFSK